MKILLNKFAQFLGRKDYSIDNLISSRDLFKIIANKLLQLIRGLCIKPFFKKSNGLIFIGRGAKIKFKTNFSHGRSCQIGANVEINALSREGISLGNNVTILRNTIIECTGVIRNIGEGLVIGNNVGIAQNCFIQVRGKVSIGNNVIFGPGVSIFSENHNFSDVTRYINEQGETRKGVIIEDGVWVASNATILDGVTIGESSIVAAGSVVNRNVPPFTIVGGIPAKFIKLRN